MLTLNLGPMEYLLNFRFKEISQITIDKLLTRITGIGIQILNTQLTKDLSLSLEYTY